MKYLWSVLLIVCVLLVHALYLFQDAGFFDKQFVRLGSYDKQPIVMQEAEELMRYRYDDRTLIDREAYSVSEEEHLLDVKMILQGMCGLLFVLAVLLLVLTLWSVLSGGSSFSDSDFFSGFVASFLGFVLLLGGVAILSWFSWNWLFDSFHRLFFVDNWSFDSQSFLIESYPWEFFRNALFAILVRTVLSLGVFAVLLGSYRSLRR